MAKNYSEKSKDPRWQKKRLEIMQRDEFMCQQCFDSESTLHVHHRAYLAGKEPWEYPNEYFITLCEECHNGEADNATTLKALNNALRIKFLGQQINELAQSINSMELQHVPGVVMSALCRALLDPEQQQKMIEDYFEHLKRKREEKEAELKNNNSEIKNGTTV